VIRPWLSSRRKVVLLCLEDVWAIGVITPSVIYLGTGWRWLVSFTSRPLYLRGNRLPYHLPPNPVGDCVESGAFVAVCVCVCVCVSVSVCVCVCIHIYRNVCVYNSYQHAAFVSGRSATDIWWLAVTDQTRFCAAIWELLCIWLTICWVSNPSVYGRLILSIVSGQYRISSQSVAQSSLASLSSAFNLKRSTAARSVRAPRFTALVIYGE